jgi:glucosamine--fructose-6-phosphate aminotransferase (isomerizing)
LAAVTFAKEQGCRVLAVVNACESALTRMADAVIYNRAGPEIAVATTKGYTTQIAALLLLALSVSTSDSAAVEIGRNIADTIDSVLNKREMIMKICGRIAMCDNAFYIGRGIDTLLTYEGALKLKEISYIHAEGYAAGELKHGTISLIEEGTPVIAIATDARLFDKLSGNLREVRARGAFTVLIAAEDIAVSRELCDEIITIPSHDPASALFGAIVAAQLIAYECARARGCDVDKPRNLAKSVTVE